MSGKKGRNREEIARGCCLSIALHPVCTDDSEQALDLFPNHVLSASDAISADNI
jgi:hypothetical protein